MIKIRWTRVSQEKIWDTGFAVRVSHDNRKPMMEQNILMKNFGTTVQISELQKT